MKRGDVRRANPVVLEEGEIADEEDHEPLSACDRNTSLETVSENMTRISSTSVEDEREREVDRVIHEVQEATGRGDLMDVASGVHMTGRLNSDVRDAAAISSSRFGRIGRNFASHDTRGDMLNEGAYFVKKQRNGPYVVQANQQIGAQPSSHYTWVPLKRKQLDRREEYGDMQKPARGPRFREVEPLKVTVRNDNVTAYPRWMLNDQRGMAAPVNNVQFMDRAVKETANPFAEELHRLRMRVEAVKLARKKENLGDNYEQVGMDIVDSDRDSRSQSSPVSALTETLTVAHEVQSRTDLLSDGADNDEDVEQLRAALLEQVKKRKSARERSPLKTALEEGELASPNSETQADESNGEGPSSSQVVEKSGRSISPSVPEQSRQPQINRKRPRNDSSSSDSDLVVLQSYNRSSRKRKESARESSSRRSRTYARQEFSDEPGRSVEEWERMVDHDKKQLKEIERKLRHRDVQKDIKRRNREKFLERADRCARELGTLEAEIEVLRCDQEKIKGRLSFLEREYEKARFDESRREAEKKAAEREKRKRLARLTEETRRIKCEEKEPEFASASQAVLETEHVKAEKLVKEENVEEQGRPLNFMDTTITLDSDEEEVSEEGSSGQSQHSAEGLFGETSVIDLSDSSDLVHDLLPIMRELEQEEEMETDFIADAEAGSNTVVEGENFQPNGRISQAVALSEKDINELKNNPLIMFSGYRVCPTFPYHLIAHQALSNKLDPLKPLCSYQLLGKCADPTCQMQHEEDYLMSDEELVCSVLAHCPTLCPPKKMFSEYARELLKEHRTKSVGEIIANLLSSLPETERRITVCEMAARCDPPSEKELEDEEHIDYEVPQQLHQSFL